MMKVLMAGVDQSTKGGMWSVVENYLENDAFTKAVNLRYVPTAVAGSRIRKAACFAGGLLRSLLILLRDRPDVVHLHVSERGSVYRKEMIAALARRFGSKVILHMHGAEFQTWYEALDARGQQRVRTGLNKADCILILGEYWRTFISGLVEDPSKIRVLYNAVATLPENVYNEDAAHLLFLGEVGKRKGAYDLLRAIKRIDGQLPAETRLMIYGPNPECDILERILSLGLQERVRYCGWADREKKEAAFAQTAINVLPSYNEGLPMTILEAMAHGIPCISTEVAAIPEAVDAHNGVLIQPGDIPALADAILTLIQDGEARKAKSDHAYQRARQLFSAESHEAGLMQIYTEIASLRS